jgi:hypothetical protein
MHSLHKEISSASRNSGGCSVALQDTFSPKKTTYKSAARSSAEEMPDGELFVFGEANSLIAFLLWS